MKKLLILPLAAIAMLGFLAVGAQADTHAFEKPAYYAVKFHSDYCGSCKIMAPEIKGAFNEGGLNKEDVLYVELDFTDKGTIHQTKLKAAALGIDGYLKKAGSKTGYMVLINPATQEELARFTKENKADDIAATIKEKIKG